MIQQISLACHNKQHSHVSPTTGDNEAHDLKKHLNVLHFHLVHLVNVLRTPCKCTACSSRGDN